MSMNVYTHLIVGQRVERDHLTSEMQEKLDFGEEIAADGGWATRFFSDDGNTVFGVSLAESDPYGDHVNAEFSEQEIKLVKAFVKKQVRRLGLIPDVKLMMIGFWW